MTNLARLAGLAALLAATAAHAVEFKPKLEAEARWFFQYEADDAPLLGAAAATLEVFQGWDDNHQRIVGEFFQRYDDNDDSRTHGDVRELYYQVIGDDFEFRLGARRVYWGVTESRHLVDVINQSDFVENIDNEDKLGQPMMNIALIRELGTLDVFLLPYQRARTFPGPEGFPRLPPVLAHEAQYESEREQSHLDYALRYVGSFGPLDLGVAWFDGTAREPRLLQCVRSGANGTYIRNPGPRANCDVDSTFVQPGPLPPPPPPDEIRQQAAAEVRANLVLVPSYDRLQQVSIDAQYVLGSTAFKLEALRRHQQERWTWASVTGFEHTLGDVGGSGADIGLLAEYLYDEKDDGFGVLADDELFVGSRLALNDVAGTQVLAGVIARRKDFKGRLFGIEASGRLNDDWRLAGEARLFSQMPDDGVEALIADQDFVTVTLERFF
jgi:hypothetical protein